MIGRIISYYNIASFGRKKVEPATLSHWCARARWIDAQGRLRISLRASLSFDDLNAFLYWAYIFPHFFPLSFASVKRGRYSPPRVPVPCVLYTRSSVAFGSSRSRALLFLSRMCVCVYGTVCVCAFTQCYTHCTRTYALIHARTVAAKARIAERAGKHTASRAYTHTHTYTHTIARAHPRLAYYL